MRTSRAERPVTVVLYILIAHQYDYVIINMVHLV